MNKLFAALTGAALVLAPMAASAQDWNRGGHGNQGGYSNQGGRGGNGGYDDRNRGGRDRGGRDDVVTAGVVGLLAGSALAGRSAGYSAGYGYDADYGRGYGYGGYGHHRCRWVQRPVETRYGYEYRPVRICR